MAAEKRPYEVQDTETGTTYLVDAAINQPQALRAVIGSRFKVSSPNTARLLALVDDKDVVRVRVDPADPDDGGE